MDDPRLKSLPHEIKYGVCGLVVLDGHLLRAQENARRWEYGRLLISQLVMGLQAVKIGGTMVVKLSRPDNVRTAKLLYLLDIISASLITCKPRSMHSNRGTFYAVAKGVRYGAEARCFTTLIEGLQKLWHELTYGGDEGHGRFITEMDLDFIIRTDELADRYLLRLIELGREVWAVQAAALRRMFKSKGIAVDD